MLILDINNNAIACPKVSVDACEIADCLKPRASEICPDVCTQGEYRLVIIICNCDYRIHRTYAYRLNYIYLSVL